MARVLDEIIDPAFDAAFLRNSSDAVEPVYARQKRPKPAPPGDAELRDLLRSLGHVA